MSDQDVKKLESIYRKIEKEEGEEAVIDNMLKEIDAIIRKADKETTGAAIEKGSEAPEKKKEEKKPTSQRLPLPEIRDVKGKEVSMTVEIEETGKKKRVRMSALDVRKDIQRRYKVLDQIMEEMG